MEMKRGVQQREKKVLSATGLLRLARVVFEKITTTKVLTQKKNVLGRPKKISIADSLMSALAMFSLKSQSLLAFDQGSRLSMVSHNLKKLYGIKHVPSDTYMREQLDEVDSTTLRGGFVSIFEAARRGKLLEQYSFLGGFLLLADGTGVFESESISCSDCCQKNHRDGRTSYYHQVLGAVIAHPNHKQVIPLCPELISKQDGVEKNDCERRALQRLLTVLKKEHPRLNLTIVCDALAANTPTINEIQSYSYHFIINVKPGSNKSLFEWVSGLNLAKTEIPVGKNKYVFRYINNVPLNDAKNSPLVNFLECKAIEVNGHKVSEKIFTFVTDHKLTKDNIYTIMQGGRARWKIENETFNTLKNQGYQFEHNFGHGNKHLISVFTLLMMLAFLIDQIQEAACWLFQNALQKTVSRRALWHAMQSYFFTYFVMSWDDLFVAIHQSIGVTLVINSS